MSCGGSSDIRIPIELGGCGSSTRYLHISSTGCGKTTYSVDGSECGGRICASNEDIRKAFEHIRNSKY